MHIAGKALQTLLLTAARKHTQTKHTIALLAQQENYAAPVPANISPA